MKKVLLLVNTGTPTSHEIRHVRRFLSEFLNDYRVIGLPWVLRKILVNLIIIPFRVPVSARLYRKLWTGKGSPLLINMENLVLKLQGKLRENFIVIGAMRYGSPSLKSALERINKDACDEIIIFPLFPQYASSTSGSIYELVMNEIHTWNIIPAIRFIGQYYSHPSFIDAFACLIKQYNPETFDHVLFSYHGLPVSHIKNVHPGEDYHNCDCHNNLPEHGTYCYKATCYETTRLLSEKLNLTKSGVSTSFQSRMSKAWMTPFTDQVLKDLNLKGKKRILVAAPSFASDCLETIIEINEEYQSLFKNEGGNEIVLVRSLNDNDKWVEAIISIAELS